MKPNSLLTPVVIFLLLIPLFIILITSVVFADTYWAKTNEIEIDIERFTGLGAEYQSDLYPEFPNEKTPFKAWQRINVKRLVGSHVYVAKGDIRVWKTMYCAGDTSEIFIQLALKTRDGKKIPFAWQACNFDCSIDGFCAIENPLYIDINGDMKPEIKFATMEKFLKIKESFFRNTRCNFDIDILPAWLKRVIGPDNKNLSTVGPSDSVRYWNDHPLGVSGIGDRNR